jgi:hypothetical protein
MLLIWEARLACGLHAYREMVLNNLKKCGNFK